MMLVHIYTITCEANGKAYVGKTLNPSRRFATHRWHMKRKHRHEDCNTYLWNAAQKHGLGSMRMQVVMSVEVPDDKTASDLELMWIDMLGTCDRDRGFNLRRDSSTAMLVHSETRKRMSKSQTGELNGNYGNRWSDDMKRAMSDDAKRRHAEGHYGEEWRSKLAKSSSDMWKDEDKKKHMAAKVAQSKQRYRFVQKTRSGEFVKLWSSVEDIVRENPGYKWQNIYSVCNGYKKTYMGFVWEKVPK